MLARYCGPGLLGLGITALIAGFMSGMAGNVSAFTTVWTYDIYGALINKNASDESKVRMGRWVHGYRRFHQYRHGLSGDACAIIMDYVQALFSFFIAPLFGTVHPGYALETCYSRRWLDGPAGGNAVFGRDVCLGQSRPGSGALCGSLHGCAGSGAKHVSRTVVLLDLRGRDGRRQLSDETKAGFRIEGRRVRPHADPERRST